MLNDLSNFIHLPNLTFTIEPVLTKMGVIAEVKGLGMFFLEIYLRLRRYINLIGNVYLTVNNLY